MKVISVNGKEVMMCEVPEGASGFAYAKAGTYGVGGKPYKPVLGFDMPGNSFQEIELPNENWHLLGLASEIKEEQWAELVEWYEDSNDSSYDPQYNVTTYFNVYTDYLNGDDCDTATESGLSLLKAHGYNPSQCILLIKK